MILFRCRWMLLVACMVANASCAQLIASMNAAAENNRTVTVTIRGAVVNPVNQNGQPWDSYSGILSPDDISLLTKMVVSDYPVGQVPGVSVLAGAIAGRLAQSAFGTMDLPDPQGSVTVSDGRSYKLDDNHNTFAPQWYTTIPNVRIHQDRLVVKIVDGDPISDDQIGVVEITEAMMLEAESSGASAYAVDCSDETTGMVRRLIFSVSRN